MMAYVVAFVSGVFVGVILMCLLSVGGGYR